jgi:hypothetical protein
MSALYLIERHAQPDTNIYASAILDVQEDTQPLLNGRFVVKVPDSIPIGNPTDLGDLLTQKSQGYLLVYAGFSQAVHDDLLDTTNVDFTNSYGIIAGKRSELVLEPGGIFQSLVVPLALGGSGATVTVSGGTVTVTGLSGMTPAYVGGLLTISGSSQAVNNGSFPILTVPTGTSATIMNPAAVTDSGGDTWSLFTGPAPEQVFITWDTFNYVETDSAVTTYSRQYNELPSVPTNVLCQVSFDGINFTPTTDSALLNIPPPVVGTSFIIQLTNASTSRLSIGSWTLIY